MPETNEKVGRCLLCDFAVQPGQGRITGKSLVHADPDVCKRLRKEEAERQERALRAKLLRRRLVARATAQRGDNASQPVSPLHRASIGQ